MVKNCPLIRNPGIGLCPETGINSVVCSATEMWRITGYISVLVGVLQRIRTYRIYTQRDTHTIY